MVYRHLKWSSPVLISIFEVKLVQTINVDTATINKRTLGLLPHTHTHEHTHTNNNNNNNNKTITLEIETHKK